MQRRIFILAGALPIIAAFVAIGVGLGLVVFGDNGSSTPAVGSTAEPSASTEASDEQAWLGISGGKTVSGAGVAISEVVSDSPADDADLEAGDVILSFDGDDVDTLDALASLVGEKKPGDEVTVSVIKAGVANPEDDATDVEVTLGTRPADARDEPDAQTGGGWLGVEGETLEDGTGVEVVNVVAESPAESAGIETGDVIVAIDGETMESFRALASLVRTHSPGDKITVTIERDGDRSDVEVTLGERARKFDLPEFGGLPDLGLGDFDIDKIIGGELQYLDSDGNDHTLSASVGDVTSISDSNITLETANGASESFDIPADVSVPDGMAEGDRAIVVSKDGEVTAVIPADIGKIFPFDGFGKQDGSPGDFWPDFDILPGDINPEDFSPNCTYEDGQIECHIDIKPSATPGVGSSNES